MENKKVSRELSSNDKRLVPYHNADGSIEMVEDSGIITKTDCIVHCGDEYYHKSLSCYKETLEIKEQNEVIDDGFYFMSENKAIETGRKKCPICFEKYLESKYKYDRLIESGNYIEFKVIGTNSNKQQELIQNLSNKQALGFGLSDRTDTWYLTGEEFDWDKCEFVPIGRIPDTIVWKILMRKNQFPSEPEIKDHIFVKTVNKNEKGHYELICIIECFPEDMVEDLKD